MNCQAQSLKLPNGNVEISPGIAVMLEVIGGLVTEDLVRVEVIAGALLVMV